jgi:ADP-ribosylglycohydrolase
VRDAGLSAVVQEIGASGFVAETIPVALEVARLMETVGVEPAMEALIRLGGDTDTIGSIAGQIWGVATGGDLRHLLREVPNSSLVLEIAGRFAHFAASA